MKADDCIRMPGCNQLFSRNCDEMLRSKGIGSDATTQYETGTSSAPQAMSAIVLPHAADHVLVAWAGFDENPGQFNINPRNPCSLTPTCY
ncbi:MAG TPA: hypothetical protein EYG03_18840 [Planctomycetes bacterium]|nr:hypothetical protein [Fuerstiella sp.]HIK94008.1 hypothetical protein [Planctomycetota bacterium]